MWLIDWTSPSRVQASAQALEVYSPRPGIGVVDQLPADDRMALLAAGPGGHPQREQDSSAGRVLMACQPTIRCA